jgi:pSer/pThr/pTyr-binding forkhead associated (FHA) protein/serine/threonine protein kinase
MGFFKRLFGDKHKTVDQSLQPPIVAIPLPQIKKNQQTVGRFCVEEKLGEISQAMPNRKAQIWQGMDGENPRFLGFIEPGAESQKWLLERLGGEQVLHDVVWEQVQSKNLWPGRGPKFACLSFRFTCGDRYALGSRLYNDDRQEAWEAYDIEGKQKVLCLLLKLTSEIKLEEDFLLRQFRGKKGADLIAGVGSGLLKVLGEGFAKIAGPFSFYRYKYTKMVYIVSAAPSAFVPMSWLLPRQRLNLEQAVSVLYQTGKVLSTLHEQGWVHGQISPYHLWLGDGENPESSVYLNGFSLLHSQRDGSSTIGNLLSTKNLTFSYPTPESVFGSELTPQTDQFLLGLTLYHLLTGKNPVKEKSPTPIHQVVGGIPKWFSEILSRMLSSTPQDRFDNLKSMLDMLCQPHPDEKETPEEEAITISPKSVSGKKSEKPPVEEDAITISPKASSPASAPKQKTKPIAIQEAVPKKEAPKKPSKKQKTAKAAKPAEEKAPDVSPIEVKQETEPMPATADAPIESEVKQETVGTPETPPESPTKSEVKQEAESTPETQPESHIESEAEAEAGEQDVATESSQEKAAEKEAVSDKESTELDEASFEEFLEQASTNAEETVTYNIGAQAGVQQSIPEGDDSRQATVARPNRKDEEEEFLQQEFRHSSDQRQAGESPEIEEVSLEVADSHKKGFQSYLVCPPYQPFPLQSHKEFRIGRDQNNDLILPAEDVSRFHTSIVSDKEGYLLKDLGSANGTQVNGQKIIKHILHNGDKIVVGGTTVFYQEVSQGRLPDAAAKGMVKKQTVAIPKFQKTAHATLSGDLAHISLWQVLQMLAGEEKSGCLKIQNGEEVRIFFVKGMVVHCQSGQQKGHEAFYNTLTNTKGTFAFDPTLAPEEVTMSDVVESLLLEGARRLDEQSRQQS